jgi:hypothetical protein
MIRTARRSPAQALSWRTPITLALALALTLPAVAAPSPIDDPEATLTTLKGGTVGELVVRPAGPAWWTVSYGERKVFILGVLSQFPDNKAWNQLTLNRRIRASSRVLVAPSLSGDPNARPLATPIASLPPAMTTRIGQAAVSLGKPAARYLGRGAAEAGILLVTDFRDQLEVGSGAIVRNVARLASLRGLVVVSPPAIETGPYVAQMKDATPEADAACLESALAEIEGGADPMRDAIEGWVVGDVRAALEAPRGLERCSFALPGQADLRRRATQDQATAIARILQPDGSTAPGSNAAIALVNLRTLLAQGGVLDQLRAKGYAITSPQF